MRLALRRSTLTLRPVAGPHAGGELLEVGPPAGEASGAMILFHGRGGRARDILSLAAQWSADDILFLAPQAAGDAWYPYRFIAPIEQNEPHLSSALELATALCEGLDAAGIPAGRQIIAGFSQGACLALEWGGRNARRFGGLVAFSGGLLGPPGTRWEFAGSLDGTPVFLGCGDPDPHIPRERVEESGRTLGAIGGIVDLRIYPGMGHTINADEIGAVQGILAGLPRRQAGTARE